MLLGFCTVAFSFTLQIHAHEFRPRANHIFWKNQEAGTEKEIDFGRGVAAKILGKYPILKTRKKSIMFLKSVQVSLRSWEGQN